MGETIKMPAAFVALSQSMMLVDGAGQASPRGPATASDLPGAFHNLAVGSDAPSSPATRAASSDVAPTSPDAPAVSDRGPISETHAPDHLEARDDHVLPAAHQATTEATTAAGGPVSADQVANANQEVSREPSGKRGGGSKHGNPVTSSPTSRDSAAQSLLSGTNNRLGTTPSSSTVPTRSSSPLIEENADRYGFKKYSNYVPREAYDSWATEYQVYTARRKVKWQRMLKEHGLNTVDPVRFPPSSAKLKRYVRKGIPAEWRGNAWFWFARGHDKLNAYPGLYQELVIKSQDLKNNDTEHIERDLHRTFPDNLRFRADPETGAESELVQALRRVLVAFSVYQPNIGYCQSLNFLAGTLLLFIDEERAFWMLVIITQHYLMGLHEVDLEQVNITQGILMVNIRDRLPKVWDALELDAGYEDNFVSNLPPISLCTASWFMSMFVCVLPAESMLRVWDCFFFEGISVLYRISLTLLKLVEPQLVAAADDMEVFQKIQTFPRTQVDPKVLLGTCFKRSNGFGHVSKDDIKSIHQFVVSRRKARKDGPQTTDRDEYTRFRPRQRLRARLRWYK